MLNVLVGPEAELVSIGRGKKSWNDLGADRKRKVSQGIIRCEITYPSEHFSILPFSVT